MTSGERRRVLDGRPVANKILDQVRTQVEAFIKTRRIQPTLVIVTVGLNKAGNVYVNRKQQVAESVGINVRVLNFESGSQQELEAAISALACERDVHAIILQLPVPAHLEKEKLISCIPECKDVDGITPKTLGSFATGQDLVAPPCTAAAVLELLAAYDISVSGRTALVIGRGRVAGLPISIALNLADATVIQAHSKTENISDLAKLSDIVVVAVGRPGFLRAEWLKAGSVVVDVGCNVLVDGTIGGDFDKECGSGTCSLRSPVPGGVGPITVAMLMRNTVRLAEFCYRT